MLLALSIAGLFVLPAPWRYVVLPAAALIEVVEVYFWIHFLRRYRVSTGVEAMVGERAEAIDRERVRVRGEIWNARSATPIGAGDSVRISSVDGLTLVVEPEPGA